MMPAHGLFVRSRLEQVARIHEVDVIAPINVTRTPSLTWKVPLVEQQAAMRVWHPRFAVVPGALKDWDGRLLYWQSRTQIGGLRPLTGYDLIDIHYAYPDGVAGQMLAREAGRPYVISLRGSDINVIAARFPRRRAQIRTVLRGASAVVAVSGALAAAAEALGADQAKVHVIRNGVDTRSFYPRDPVQARSRLGWELRTYTLIAVGRLTAIKGFGLLIEAIRLVREKLAARVHCYIVGEGEMRDTLEAQISRLGLLGDVQLCGRVSPNELPERYSAADLSCLVSEQEGCPNVVLESLACGTPVVAMAVGGVPELINHGVTGLLVRDRTPEALAQAIESGLRTRWEREAVHRKAGIRDWAEVAAQQVDVYERVVGVS